eukprot:7638078-Pyramimonas_sp.AAC.1
MCIRDSLYPVGCPQVLNVSSNMIERVEGLNELPLLHTLLIAGGNYAYEERLDGRIQGPAWHG